MSDLLARLSSVSTIVIWGAAAIHLLGFILLWLWFRRDTKVIAASLDRFTHGLKHRSVLEATGTLGDQIEAFLADANEILTSRAAADDRRLLLERINILDERRGYLNSLPFETAYNVARTMVEAYPLAGTVGAILAIGAALTAPESESTVTTIVSQFGEAIWSTFAGLASAILLMFVNSLLEPKFLRLAENRTHVRETIAKVKRELAFESSKPATPSSPLGTGGESR